MSLGDIFRNLTSGLRGDFRVTNENNTKEAEKNMQQNQMQYLDYVETPDEEPRLERAVSMYAIYPDEDFKAIPDEPEPAKEPIVEIKYGIPRQTVEPSPEVQPLPTQEVNPYNPWLNQGSTGNNPSRRSENRSRGAGVNTDELRQNLAQAFTNLFVKPATSFSQRVSGAINNFFSKWW